MMIPSNTQYKWRLDIIRKHVKIGEAKISSCSVDFIEDAEVTRTMRAKVPIDGFALEGIRIKQDDNPIYFDGTRVFDGSWCFTSVTGSWIEVENSNGQCDIINGEYITRIREYPRNKNGKKKSIITD